MSKAIEVGRRIGRAMARDAKAEGMARDWTGLDPQDADVATAAGLVPDDEEWGEMERAARRAFLDALSTDV
jgi:prephenate dehydrogenase